MEESGAGKPSPEDRQDKETDWAGWVTPPPENWKWGSEEPDDGQPAASDENSASDPDQDSRPAGSTGAETVLLGRQQPRREEAAAKAPRKRGILRWAIRDVVIPLAIAFGVAMIFQATIAKPYQIPTGSMIPTINENDRILADRIVYHFKPIQRGDVIVFNPPRSVDSADPFVKRVIGLPGDTVEVKKGQLLVNGQPFVVPTAKPTDYTMAEETVPPGQLFVLGDNRDDSYDSHRWGFVPIENVIGRADVIYWPLPHLTWLG